MLTVTEKPIVTRERYRYGRPRMALGDAIVTLTGALFVLISLVPAGSCSEVPSQSSSSFGCSTAWTTSSSSVVAVAPDLSITSSDIYIQHGSTNISHDVFGKVDSIHAVVRNLGDSNASVFGVDIGIRNAVRSYNHTLYRSISLNLSADQPENAVEIILPWVINMTSPGAFEIWVLLDQTYEIDESNESNNWAVQEFTLDPLQVDVLITTDKTEYEAGEMIVISAAVTYTGTEEPVKHLPFVRFVLIYAATGIVVPESETSASVTDETGSIVTVLRIPSTVATAVYTVRALVLDVPRDSHQQIMVDANDSNAVPVLWNVALAGTIAAIVVIVALLLLKKQEGPSIPP